jgi:hypothetical protein
MHQESFSSGYEQFERPLQSVQTGSEAEGDLLYVGIKAKNLRITQKGIPDPNAAAMLRDFKAGGPVHAVYEAGGNRGSSDTVPGIYKFNGYKTEAHMQRDTVDVPFMMVELVYEFGKKEAIGAYLKDSVTNRTERAITRKDVKDFSPEALAVFVSQSYRDEIKQIKEQQQLRDARLNLKQDKNIPEQPIQPEDGRVVTLKDNGKSSVFKRAYRKIFGE